MKPQGYFYTTEPIMKRVSKEEFLEFIKNYPRRLIKDCNGICDPPSITYNDFELANRWPYSIVASTFVYSDDPQDYYYMPDEERVYSIVANYEEVFNSKTGKMAKAGE
jgi:hypothetical protein